MKIISPSFETEQMIPSAHTCDGQDISPALEWQDAPPGTRQYALVMDDPDAPGGIFIHWVIYGIPVENNGLKENIPPKDNLPDGSRQGRNSWGRIGYGGPCPPSGIHHYRFKLYALDKELDLASGLTDRELMSAIQSHVLTEAQLIGLYQRSR